LQRQQLDAVVYALQAQHHYQQQVDAAAQNPQEQDDGI